MSRVIRPEMIRFLDESLVKNGLAKFHVQNKNPRGLMLEAAKVSVGQRELTGQNDGWFVETVQKTVDGSADAEPWCMAFVQTMIAYAEFKTGIKSPLKSTEHCLTLFRDTKSNCPEQLVKYNPLAGAIIIWRHGNTENGHTGFVMDADEREMNALEGNASGFLEPVSEQMKSVNREGNGVYYTRRSRFGNGDMSILGFIKPF